MTPVFILVLLLAICVVWALFVKLNLHETFGNKALKVKKKFEEEKKENE